jgi:hypothetical protein
VHDHKPGIFQYDWIMSPDRFSDPPGSRVVNPGEGPWATSDRSGAAGNRIRVW